MKTSEFKDPKKALLIIDIQEDYTGATAKPPFPYKDSGRLIATVNHLIRKASEKDIVIVYIKQEFSGFIGKMISGDTAIKGSLGAEIDKRIAMKSDHIFSKPLPSAFSNHEFEAFLNGRQVNELYLVGLDAEYCVHATAKAALKKGYKVWIITDGIVLKNERKWPKLLEKYHQEGIHLISSKELLSNQTF